MQVYCRGLAGVGVRPAGARMTNVRRPGADCGGLQPDPLEPATPARANKGQHPRGAPGSGRTLPAPPPLAARVEPKNGPKNKKAGQILTAFGCVRFQRSEGLLFAEQVELPTVVVTFWRDGLVVTAYLGKVARLELQGDLHQGVRNVSGGFIGDGVFGRLGCALARHRGRPGLTLQSRPSCGSSCLR